MSGCGCLFVACLLSVVALGPAGFIAAPLIALMLLSSYKVIFNIK